LRKQKVLILILPIYAGHLYLMRFCYQDIGLFLETSAFGCSAIGDKGLT
jgi:hypothetical protein